jgi:hypothetical protein
MAKSKHNTTGNGTHRQRTVKARQELEMARVLAELEEKKEKALRELQKAQALVGEAKKLISELPAEVPIPQTQTGELAPFGPKDE